MFVRSIATRSTRFSSTCEASNIVRAYSTRTCISCRSIAIRRNPVASSSAPTSIRSSSAPRSFSTHAPSSSSSHHAHHPHPHPSILVVGGSGALGSAMIDTFKHAGWKTICMDFKSNPSSDVNITLARTASWKANLTLAEESLNEINDAQAANTAAKRTMPLSVVVHCAGSWMGGNLTDSSFLDTIDPMLDINLKSGISAAYLASKFLSDSGAGLLVLTGAAAAGGASSLTPTSSMIGYGLSKSATHQLALSCATKDSGLKNANVVCLLPTMIDTPSNRQMMKDEQLYKNWTPPREFADLVLSFAQQLQGAIGMSGRAASGSASVSKPSIEHAPHVPLRHGGFYNFTTQNGKTIINLVP